jgi:chemotaxis response regulator CheB
MGENDLRMETFHKLSGRGLKNWGCLTPRLFLKQRCRKKGDGSALSVLAESIVNVAAQNF